MKKTVYLPDYLEDFAEAYARDYVEEIKRLGPDDRGYNNAINKARHSFCTDYHESLTGIESNPTSAKARESFEALFPVLFKEDGLLSGKVKNEEHARLIQQRLKSSIMHLVHTYMIVVAGIEPEDTQYKEGKSTEEEKMKVAKARLSRSLLVMIFFSHILGAFRMNPDALNSLITKIIDNNGLAKVNDPEFRKDFAINTWKVLKEEISKIKIINPLYKAFQNKIFNSSRDIKEKA